MIRRRILAGVGEGVFVLRNKVGVQHHAVDAIVPDHLRCRRAPLGGQDSHVVEGEVLQQFIPPRRRLRDHEQGRLRRAEEALHVGQEGRERVLALDRLADERERSGTKRPLAGVIRRNDDDGNVAGRGIVLQSTQDPPAVDVGQEQIERDRRGRELSGEIQGHHAARCHNSLEPQFARRFEKQARKSHVVLDDEQDVVTRVDGVAVIADLIDELDNGG